MRFDTFTQAARWLAAHGIPCMPISDKPMPGPDPFTPINWGPQP